MFKKLQKVLLTLALWVGVGSLAMAQTANGVVVDTQDQPIPGASVIVKGTTTGTMTDIDGQFSIAARPGAILEISCIGYAAQEVNAGTGIRVVLKEDNEFLEESVVTALGIKRERKSLGYAVEDINAEELMRNKNTNAINSLAGKIAGVNVTQSSGAAGSGAQIILRGGTSSDESRDNQPLFVVDGIIYDNSSQVVGNSAFDGTMKSATTAANRVMDINPEDIESMSVLKGPAASALYGSRAANGVVLITTKKGKEGTVEVNVSAKYINNWVEKAALPAVQHQYRRGFMEDQYNADKEYTGTTFNDFSYNSWGEEYAGPWYDNMGNFFKNSSTFDGTVSVAGGTKNSNFYLSGSYYDQAGIVPETGYQKYSFRFNGEQMFHMFTFGASAAYSQAHTDRTLTGAALYGSSGTGALYAVYNWAPSDDMRDYLNEDGTRRSMFPTKLDPEDERDNPYWIVNNNKMYDNTSRFTGNFTVKADITPWWWVQARIGIDKYTTVNTNRFNPGGVMKKVWQKGMISDNTLDFTYLSTNFISNMNKQLGDFNLNLLLGMSTDDTMTNTDYKMAYMFATPFMSYANTINANKQFSHAATQKRLVGVFGEFRADWKNTVFLTVTGRNDWTSTLPRPNRSYFYPSVSGSVVFTQPLIDAGIIDDNVLSFGKLRVSWAEVGKDTNPYVTSTQLWPAGDYFGIYSAGNYWSKGNPILRPERTRSTEVGLELSFFKNRLHVDYAYYTNDSYDQILSPRTSQATGYIFCAINAGDVLNKGMELTISGTPVLTKEFAWNSSMNIAGNRGKMTNFPAGLTAMYVTDVQYGTAKAGTIKDGCFMGIAGYKYVRNEEGEIILDDNGFPTHTGDYVEVGNREALFTGGFNNTFSWKGFTLNMLWEFRVGGDVYNGTKYAMTQSGVSQLSADIRTQSLTVSGVDKNGNAVTHTWEPDKVYTFNGVKKLGVNIIEDYYTNYYPYETSNFISSVNSLRLRTLSLTYDVPKKALDKIGFIKRAAFTLSANNLLLFTNYEGDPEVAAAGAGVGGSSSVGFDYCGVPAMSGMSFGVNLTF
ncbi:MAG: SusC/RagA family TonB-linked outer membrane protein [Bacteroidales bacterium]|nr:SusC/RagA family TonB-linked outer membrane protein [Bacteroidales bacterium]